MRIFDCFMYFDEEIVLDTRLNYLNPFVDYFVIIESCYTHRGDKRNLKFDINKFEKFKDKIIYKVYNIIPDKIEEVYENDDEGTKSYKYILNAIHRENGQRNFISEGIKDAENEDIILVSDVDEIPNLSNIDLKKVKEKIIFSFISLILIFDKFGISSTSDTKIISSFSASLIPSLIKFLCPFSL